MRSGGTLLGYPCWILSSIASLACSGGQVQPPAPVVIDAGRCVDPASRDQWDPFREERIDSSTSVFHAAWPAGAIQVPDARLLAGAYDIVFITTSPARGSTVRGELTLVVTRSDMADLRGLTDRMPLIGWASIDLSRLGYLPIAHSLDRRDPGRPGIQMDVEAESGRLSAVAGNSLEFRDGSIVSKTTDVGVGLYFFVADSSRLLGRWSGGGLSEPRTEGYFCATKVAAPPPNGGW